MAEKRISMESGGAGTALAVQIRSGAPFHRIENIDFKNGSVLIGLNCSTAPSEINLKLVNYLANILGVGSNQIEIVAGHENNKKLISIMQVHPDEVQTILMKELDRS